MGPLTADDGGADADAARRVAAILASPSYRQADRDVEFLDRDETRGVRLQIDYLKAELLLQQFGIERTIVVFGSTRFAEPAAAQCRLDALREEARSRPGDEDLARRVAVAARVCENSRYYEIARELGRLVGLARRGPRDCRLTVVTGGGPGIMEAANRGAFDAGAPSAGLNIALAQDQAPNPYVTPELCLRFHYFGIRKLHFLLRARALVAFPGGYGTLDELFETLALVQTRTIPPVPVILIGERWWRRAFDADFLVEQGVIEPADRALFHYAETAAGAWESILRWHEINGTSLQA